MHCVIYRLTYLAERKVDFLALVLQLLRLTCVVMRPEILVLDVTTFERLLGPTVETWVRNAREAELVTLCGM